MEHLLGQILHVGISVYDMEQSLAWYRDVLGFRLIKDDGFLPPLGARICFMEKDGFQLELFEYQQPKPLPADRLLPNDDLQTVGTKHAAFQVPDMDAMLRHLADHDIEPVQNIRMGADRVVFIHDCNGILIELIETP